MAADGLIQSIASALNIMRPDADRIELWIGAMASGDYKFGYGLLRSGDDEFDPFGVLAAISFPDWTWDDNEDAWAINGQALYLSTANVMEWLGITQEQSGARGLTAWVDRFQQAVTEAADSVADFPAIVEIMKEAVVRSRSAQKRAKELTFDMIGRPERYIGESRSEYMTTEDYGGDRGRYFYGPR